MVVDQNWQFILLFVFGNIEHETVFYDILERKKELFRL